MKQVSFGAVLPLVVNDDMVAGVDRFVRAATLSPKNVITPLVSRISIDTMGCQEKLIYIYDKTRKYIMRSRANK